MPVTNNMERELQAVCHYILNKIFQIRHLRRTLSYSLQRFNNAKVGIVSNTTKYFTIVLNTILSYGRKRQIF